MIHEVGGESNYKSRRQRFVNKQLQRRSSRMKKEETVQARGQTSDLGSHSESVRQICAMDDKEVRKEPTRMPITA